MPGAINILVSHHARLIAVGLPKCGSSTLVEVFLQMEGFQPKPRKVRDMAVRLRKSGDLARAGLEFHQCYPQDIGPVVAANPGYRMFSIVRDPYRRIYSAYFNKLNRYTSQFRRDLYLRGQLARLLAGPRGWQRVEVGNQVAHRDLSFPQFLAELERLGVAIDPHFDLQVKLLDLPNQSYDRLLDIKDMKTGLKALLADLGAPQAMLARLPDVPHANQRAAAEDAAWLTPEVARQIERLYAPDFDGLGMARRAAG